MQIKIKGHQSTHDELDLLLLLHVTNSCCLGWTRCGTATIQAVTSMPLFILCRVDLFAGFISIDCGYTASKEYVDSSTGITYASDDGFIDAGLVQTVEQRNLQLDLAVQYFNLRYFPSGARNCYTFRYSLTAGGKYLVRAAFGYGDYDKLNRLPSFDLYFGVNYWTTVTIVSSSTAYVFEIIAVSPADFLQTCLMNIGLGTPFISALDLRSLTANLYPKANVTQSLVLLSFFRDTVTFGTNRYHFGTNYQYIR